MRNTYVMYDASAAIIWCHPDDMTTADYVLHSCSSIVVDAIVTVALHWRGDDLIKSKQAVEMPRNSVIGVHAVAGQSCPDKNSKQKLCVGICRPGTLF